MGFIRNIIFALFLISLPAKAQELLLVNLNTHDTLRPATALNWYAGTESGEKPLYGKIKVLGDSSLMINDKKVPLQELAWLSSKDRRPRKKADRLAKNLIGLHALGILTGGIYSLDDGDTKPMQDIALYGSVLTVPSLLWLWLHHEPEYDLKGSWIAFIR